jgi:hypothetical protein
MASPRQSPGVCSTVGFCGRDTALRHIVSPRSELNCVTASAFTRAEVALTGDRVMVRTIEVEKRATIWSMPSANSHRPSTSCARHSAIAPGICTRRSRPRGSCTTPAQTVSIAMARAAPRCGSRRRVVDATGQSETVIATPVASASAVRGARAGRRHLLPCARGAVRRDGLCIWHSTGQMNSPLECQMKCRQNRRASERRSDLARF